MEGRVFSDFLYEWTNDLVQMYPVGVLFGFGRLQLSWGSWDMLLYQMQSLQGLILRLQSAFLLSLL